MPVPKSDMFYPDRKREGIGVEIEPIIVGRLDPVVFAVEAIGASTEALSRPGRTAYGPGMSVAAFVARNQAFICVEGVMQHQVVCRCRTRRGGARAGCAGGAARSRCA